MITSAYYTDFLYRPRRREELDTAQGGGVMYNQAPHQVDVARLLGGGLVSSVRANVGIWDRARPTEGAYQALLTFESGATASLTYSGYAHFDGDELVDWITEGGLPKDPARYGATRKALGVAASLEEEERLKARVNYGGEGYGGPQNATASADQQRFHQHFGLVVASCTGADLRPTRQGRARLRRRRAPLRGAGLAAGLSRRGDRRALRRGGPRRARHPQRRVGPGDHGSVPRDARLARAKAARSRSHHQVGLEGRS